MGGVSLNSRLVSRSCRTADLIMAISLCLTFLEARLENTRVKRSPATLARPHHVYKLMSKVNVTLIVFWEIDLKSIPFSEVLLSTCLLNVFSAYISEVSLATSPPLLIAIIVGSVVVFLAIVCCGVYVKCNQRAKKKDYACKPRQDGVYKIISLYICECNLNFLLFLFRFISDDTDSLERLRQSRPRLYVTLNFYVKRKGLLFKSSQVM